MAIGICDRIRSALIVPESMMLDGYRLNSFIRSEYLESPLDVFRLVSSLTYRSTGILFFRAKILSWKRWVMMKWKYRNIPACSKGDRSFKTMSAHGMGRNDAMV